MSELVSILIPAHNEQRWIGATLRSAIGQSWPHVEVIVVDDGSTDGTAEAAESIGAPNIKVVRQPNRGASAARNHALTLAQGQYIQWLDADDLLAPDKIASQMRLARELGDTNTLLTSAFAEFFVRPEKGVFRPTSLWKDLAPVDFLLHKFVDNAWLNTATWLVSRELATRAGPWNESLSLDDDGEYFARLLTLASSVRFVPEAKVYYRRADPGSLSRGVSERACESLLTSLELCIGHLRTLEDSARTRAASVQLLQNWIDRSDCFCIDAPARFERARALARQCDGDLKPHRMSWKYAPIQAVFGPAAARRARITWSNLKLTAKARLDEWAADLPWKTSMNTHTLATVADLMKPLQDFVAWLDRFGETSYDHQSYFAGPIGGRAKALYYRHKAGIVAVAPMIASEAFFPAARQLFWKKQRFPIADAHYAMGFALLAGTTGERSHLARAVHFLEALEQTRCRGYEHAGWGYPFDWVTRNGVMKAQTPLITSTPYAYEAFAAVHRLDGDERWLRMMASAAEHALREIPDLELGADEASCAYNPHDTEFRVVNASAYRAFLLFAAAEHFGRDDFAAAARRNLNFVLRAQQSDGSWKYAMDGVRDFVDHFHTCFVLKALAKIEALTGDTGCRLAIERGVDYYVQHLFDDDGLPRPFAVAPRLTIYRHELYDYAECINLGALLRGRFAPLDQRVDAAVADLLVRWTKPDGSFRSRKLMFGWDNVPMHRWAQAQLFRSLAFLQSKLLTAPLQAPSMAQDKPTISGEVAAAH